MLVKMMKQAVILLVLTFCQILYVSSVNANIITVPITNNYDSIGNPSYCNNNSTLLCNVRSAFKLCNLYSNANLACQIVLQSNSNVIFNSSYGTITLNSTANIVLLGYSSIMNLIINKAADKFSSLITYNTYSSSIPRLYIDSVVFSSFKSVSNGAVLYTNKSIVVTLNSCVFNSSIAASTGGSVYFNNSKYNSITINSCQFNSNKANFGGALCFYANNFNISITNSRFFNNSGIKRAASVYLYSNNKNVKIQNTTFLTNPSIAGVIYIRETLDNFYIYNSSFMNNAAQSGGALYFSLDSNISRMTIDQSYFLRNRALQDGGAIFFGSTLIDSAITNSNFTGNIAGTNGGAIRSYSNSIRVVIANNVFQDNMCSVRKPYTYPGADIALASSTNILIENNSMTGGGKGASFYICGLNFTSVNMTVLNNIFFNVSGGIEIDSTANSSVTNNTFISQFGGSAYSTCVTQSTNIVWSNNCYQNITSNNTMKINDNNVNITVIDSYFAYNKNNYNGGAIYIDTNNSIINIINTTFIQNKALNGGAIYSNTLNSYLTIAACSFIGNTANQKGGAVMIAQQHTNLAIIDYSTYYHSFQLQTKHPYTTKSAVGGVAQVIFNSSIQVAGVSKFIISFDSRSSIWASDKFYIYDNTNKTTILYENTLNDATWPGVYSTNLVIYSDEFYVEFVGPTHTVTLVSNYWGFLCNVYPIFTNDGTHTSYFYQNTASSGGALYMSFLNTFSVVVSTDFTGNNATIDGGAISAYLTNYGQTFVKLRFSSNTANSGGGMSLASSNYASQIMECYFYNNSAVTGAGIYVGAYNGQGLLASNNEILISDTYFSQNMATAGAGVFANQENIVLFSNVNFIDNYVTSSGAAVSVNSNNVVNISSTTMTNNTAGTSGGGLFSLASNSISTISSSFSKNSATSGAGGAIALQESSLLTVVGSNSFLNNSAQFGGAISGSVIYWSTTSGSLVFIGNEALVGSAISLTLLEESETETTLTNVSFISNTATVAGTFFWSCKGATPGNISSCVEPKHHNLQFSNNSAPYGATFATQPIYIRTSSQYNVTVYNGPLQPPISLDLYDYYGQKAVSDTTTSTAVDVINSNCDEYIGILSSATNELADQGVVTFADLTARCVPNGNLTVQYTAQLSNYFNDNSGPSYNFNTTSVLFFRSCYNGEKFVNGACVSCSNGTYSLIYSEDQPCMKCPKEATECYANSISLDSGYWRDSETSDIIFTCPYLGCRGGYGVGENLCEDGYEGVLCAVCSSGFYLNTNSNQCIQCRGAEVLSISMIAVIAVLFVGILGFCVYSYIKHVSTINTDDDDDGIDKSLMSRLKEKFNKFYKKVGPIMSKLKIIISTYQILSISLQSFQISMPVSYTRFMGSLDFLTIDMISVVPVGCIKRINFFELLVIKTLFPPFLIGLLFIIFMLEFSIRSKKLIKEHRDVGQLKAHMILLIKNLKFRYASIALLFTYLNLPGLTVSIFQSFICQNIILDYYLVADYSLNCSSSSMTYAKVWASFSIIIYPIGIPLLYFWLLFKHRYDIVHRHDDECTTATGPQRVKMFKFLYDSYKPQYWYFEIVETSRRLMLTGALSVVNAGSSGQVIFGILLSVLYMKLFSYFQPYELEESSVIAELAQYQIFFSFFGSLIVQNSLLAPLYNNFIGGMMIVLNLAAALLSAYYEYKESRKEDISLDTLTDSPDNHIKMPEVSNPLQHRISLGSKSNVEKFVVRLIGTVQTVDNDGSGGSTERESYRIENN